MVTRTRDNTRNPKQYPDYIAYLSTPSETEPRTFIQANTSPKWKQAMITELEALSRNKTWSLVPPPPNANIVGSKWVFKIKHNADGSVARYKARLVAKGFTQEEGIDYFDTFSPVIRPTTIRLVISIAVQQQWPLRQLDIQNAFLHGDLHETVYMSQPPGFLDSEFPSHVCQLHKALYGLKQSSRAWFNTLSSALLALGFKGSQFDPSLFIFSSHGQLVYILVYVDDLIVTGNNSHLIQQVISSLQKQFALTDMGSLHYFLGLEVTSIDQGLSLTQSKYINDLLQRTNMHESHPSPSPMVTNLSISKHDGDPMDNPSFYRMVVGALQYVTITRPDITFAVNKCSQFMHQPTLVHWAAVKRILRYLRGTSSHGLQFTQATNSLLHVYCDSDWAGCPDDRRSTTGFCVYHGSNLISWSSKKQTTVARSSTEAEYRSLAIASTEIIWLQFLLQELHMPCHSPPLMWCDNIGATFLASNPAFHARTKHVEIDYHFIRERVSSNQLHIRFLSSKDQLADVFTKPLSTPRFLFIRDKLTVFPLPLACGGPNNNMLHTSLTSNPQPIEEQTLCKSSTNVSSPPNSTGDTYSSAHSQPPKE